MKIVFVASIIRNSLCMIYVFYYFFQKSLFTENYFLIAAINFATRGPLYTCLVLKIVTKKKSNFDVRSVVCFQVMMVLILLSESFSTSKRSF